MARDGSEEIAGIRVAYRIPAGRQVRGCCELPMTDPLEQADDLDVRTWGPSGPEEQEVSGEHVVG
jgi:hypothetical protein